MTPEPTFTHSGLRRNVLLPMALAMLAGLVIFYVVAFAYLRQGLQEKLDEQSSEVASLYHSLVELHSQSLNKELLLIARDPLLQEAMRRRDRSRLLAVARPLFAEIFLPNDITHLYFHSPDGTNFLRVHQPDRHGDLIDRHTLKQAQATGKIAAGVELGPLGTFTLRLVLPWRVEGELLGYLEIGEEVQHLLSSIHDILGNELALLIDKERLDEESWQQGVAMLHREESWNEHPRWVIVDETRPELTSRLLKELQRTEAGSELRFAQGSRSFDGRLMPLQDAAGSEIGNLLFLQETTHSIRAFRRTVLWLTLFSLTLGLGMILFSSRILLRFERRLDDTQRQVLKEFENTTRVKEELESEMQVRLAAEAALSQSRDELEITVVRRTQELQEQRMLLGRILDHIPSKVFWKDRNLLYAGCNQGFAELVGLTRPEEIVGKRDIDLPWAGNRLLAWQQEDREVLQSGQPLLRREICVKTQEGQDAWFLLSLIPLRDPNRTITGIVGIFAEITERKQRELALLDMIEEAQRSHSQSEGVFRSVREPVLVVEDDGRIAMVNPAAEALFDITQSQAAGRPLAEAIPLSPLRQEMLAALASTAEESLFESELPAAQGAPSRHFEIRRWRVNRRGEVGGSVLLLRDVTREWQLDQLKSDFISTAAHELRTPLATILGFAELLLMEENLSPAQQLEFKTLIFENAESLSLLLDNLLDISRIESGRPLALQWEERSLTDLLDPVLSRWRHANSEHTFKLSLQAKETRLHVDELRVRQVLDNLLSNAVKYSPQGGTIEIRGSLEPTGRYRIAISDQGSGMSEEEARQAFEPFFRTQSAMKSAKGAGLGLAIVKTLVEAHGGSVRLRSVPDHGTEVSFTLPCSAVPSDVA